MMRDELPSDPLVWLRESPDLDPPEGARARVAARLQALASPIASSVVPSGAAPPPVAPESGTIRLLAERFVRWSLVPLGLGVGLGAGVNAMRGGEHLVSRTTTLPTTATAPASAVSGTSVSGSGALSAEPPRVVPSVSARAPVLMKSNLAAERDLLDRARRELSSGEAEKSLEFLEQHAMRHPRGQLSEEREAMWVNVLARLGRASEAKAKGEAFAQRFPNSLMGSSVRAALRAAEANE